MKVYRSSKAINSDEQKKMFERIYELCGSDQALKRLKDHFVPKHLCCPISGELMSEPVTV